MSDKYHVYIILNTINGKIYVGETNNIERRWKRHLADAKSGKKMHYIHRAIRKYGKKEFRFRVLQSFTDKQTAIASEIYWISYFNSTNSNIGYNLTAGGEGVLGHIVSAETREKIRIAHTGMKHTEETKEKLRIIQLGKIPINIETLKTMHKNVPLTEEHKINLSKSLTGKKKSEEHRKNLSIALTGKLVGDKNPFYGKFHTEEAKSKISGENNHSTKLTDLDVLNIRKEFASGLISKQKIADKYKVSREHVRDIINRKKRAFVKEIDE